MNRSPILRCVLPILGGFLVAAGSVPVEAAEPKPIAPSEAKDHVGEEVVVRFTVAASKKAVRHKRVFLDSKADFNDPENLGVAVDEAAEEALARRHSVPDVAAFLLGKTVRATGRIAARDGRTYLDVTDPAQLELVE